MECCGHAVATAKPGPGTLSVANLELVFDRDSKIDDGRFANNGWLQEVPDPMTKLAWDNAAIISPKTARDLGVASGDVVRLELAGRTMEIAALVVPGQADYSIGVALGYGRKATGRVGHGVGFDAYQLRTTAAPDIALGVKLSSYRAHLSAGLHGPSFHDGGPRPGSGADPGSSCNGPAARARPRRSSSRSKHRRCSTESISGEWRSI